MLTVPLWCPYERSTRIRLPMRMPRLDEYDTSTEFRTQPLVDAVWSSPPQIAPFWAGGAYLVIVRLRIVTSLIHRAPLYPLNANWVTPCPSSTVPGSPRNVMLSFGTTF